MKNKKYCTRLSDLNNHICLVVKRCQDQHKNFIYDRFIIAIYSKCGSHKKFYQVFNTLDEFDNWCDFIMINDLPYSVIDYKVCLYSEVLKCSNLF